MVDQGGDDIEILVQTRKNKKAAMSLFNKLLKEHKGTPLKVVIE